MFYMLVKIWYFLVIVINGLGAAYWVLEKMTLLSELSEVFKFKKVYQ